MGFLGALSLLAAAAFLVVAFQRQRIGDVGRYQKALGFFVAALILYYPMSTIFAIGGYVGLVSQPLGFILEVMSLRLLCLALLS